MRCSRPSTRHRVPTPRSPGQRRGRGQWSPATDRWRTAPSGSIPSGTTSPASPAAKRPWTGGSESKPLQPLPAEPRVPGSGSTPRAGWSAMTPGPRTSWRARRCLGSSAEAGVKRFPLCCSAESLWLRLCADKVSARCSSPTHSPESSKPSDCRTKARRRRRPSRVSGPLLRVTRLPPCPAQPAARAEAQRHRGRTAS